MEILLWAIGLGKDYVSSKVSRFIQDVYNDKSLNSQLAAAVDKWLKSESFHNDTVVALFNWQSQETGANQPYRQELAATISAANIPTGNQWKMALMERYHEVRSLHPSTENLQPLFTKSQEEAGILFARLGDLLTRVCAQNEALFRNHAYSQLREILDEVRNITKALPDNQHTSPVSPRNDIQLPTSYSNYLVGRERELEQLDNSWKSNKTRIVTITAWGGVGKTTLVKLWLQRMAPLQVPVFAWSFYSQGSGDMAMSTDTFFERSLAFYGEVETSGLTVSEKADKLCSLIEQTGGVVILDGLEPLQYASSPLKGFVKDAGIRILISQLTQASNGLCIITSRHVVKDLVDNVYGTHEALVLKNLDLASSVRLLKQFVQTGPAASFKSAARYFKNHALSLTLLGNLLHNSGKTIDDYKQVALLNREEFIQGNPAFRMMYGYDQWLPQEAVQFVRLLGFFNRPATADEFNALLSPPKLKGLNDLLPETVDNIAATEIKIYLNDNFLLQLNEGTYKKDLDTHPLVREFQQLRLKEQPAVWEEGNRRLYKYMSGSVTTLPSSNYGIIQLYTAAQHGCRANLHKEVFGELFQKRIWRDDNYFSTNTLGLLNDELDVLVHFFERPFDKPHPNLPNELHGQLFAQVALCLKGSLRLRESLIPYEGTTAFRLKNAQYQEAVINACNLCQMYLYLGNLERAKLYGKRAIEYSGMQQEGMLAVWRTAPFTNLATAYMESGDWQKADKAFAEAVSLLHILDPNAEYLYTSRGIQYAEYLIAQQEAAIWRSWLNNTDSSIHDTWHQMPYAVARYGLSQAAGRPFLMASYNLIFARISILRYASGDKTADLRTIELLLDEAERQFIVARLEYELPKIYIAKAALHCCIGKTEHSRASNLKALEILSTAEKLVNYCGLVLYKVQLLLVRAKVLITLGQDYKTELETTIQAALKLTDTYGYLRLAEQINDIVENRSQTA
jgi:hypothetical protein